MSQSLPLCGIDYLLQDETLLRSLASKKIALVTNQNALTQNYHVSAHVLVEKLGQSLKCILTPEHGWTGFIKEGVKINDIFDPFLQRSILSLYGKNKQYVDYIRQEKIDTILVDLQDVGLRCYTYVSTCAQLLEDCANFPIEVIVCDRPNPLGPAVRGPDLDASLRSLVGYLPVPFQHGQTLGNLLAAFNQKMKQPLPLRIIACPFYHQPYRYPWIPPSPNLPSWEAVLIYPALVLLEGTNISEGRGTTLPFTCLGAPRLDHTSLVAYLNEIKGSGIRARPLTFTPQGGKLAGVDCQGVHLLLTNSLQINALEIGLHIISFLKKNYSEFQWDKKIINDKEFYFIDYLLGTNFLRISLDENRGLADILKGLKV